MQKFNELLEKYSEVVLSKGINIQKKQTLVIRGDVGDAKIIRIFVKKAYELGAGNVVVKFADEQIIKIKVEIAPEEALAKVSKHEVKELEELAENGAAFLSVLSSDPDLFKGVDGQRVSKMIKALAKAKEKYIDYIKSSKVNWCVIGIPSSAWAKKVYPTLKENFAIEKLWKNIFSVCRIYEENPVEAWKFHIENLKKWMIFLNNKNFKSLHYKASNGTDLIVELPEFNKWIGGILTSQSGIDFIPNMPTEEVFTSPLKYGVNGIVYSSKPLNYSGNVIDEYYFKFENGKIVDFDAKIGKEALESMITLDENACYLGEVALVPYNSPISNSNTIFYNILYDENASCHFAVGSSYPMCIENGVNMTKEELKKIGVNSSIQHVDFMIGTKDLSIVGTTATGEKIEIFANGNFAF